MKTKKIIIGLAAALMAFGGPDAVAGARGNEEGQPEMAVTKNDDVRSGTGKDNGKGRKFISRLTVGGYGEAVATWNFYTDNINRYKVDDPKKFADDPGHGRFDLPHVVINLGYDFGRGWTMGMEIEFEHGGTESAVEVESDEAGEFEKEIERGGEVALEQFWLQKSFCSQLNVRAGHIIVPVGLTNGNHLPTEFFTVYRQEGENTILPCTWHETGFSVWGRAGDWRYEAQFLPGLNSNYFDNAGWIHDGSASPYEFKVANKFAGAFRIDNYSVRGLRLGLSGYAGNSFGNDAVNYTSKYKGVKGTVLIGAFDFEYKGRNVVARGNFDYGSLSDAAAIGTKNQNQDHSTNSPYPHTLVGKAAVAYGAEAGYDFFGLCPGMKGQKLYLFGRYEHYNPYIAADGATEYLWTRKDRMAVGLNYYPMKEIVIKAEYSRRFLDSKFNPEPSVSIGIAFSGFFRH